MDTGKDGHGNKLHMDVASKILVFVLLAVIVAAWGRATVAWETIYSTVPAHEDLFRGPVDPDTGRRRASEGVLGRLKAVEDRPVQQAIPPEVVEDLRTFLAKQKAKKAGGS